MRIHHILNGDALKENFPLLKGVCIIFRECLIDGPVSDQLDESFLTNRAEFISSYFNTSSQAYNKKALPEIQKLQQIQKEDQVNLWFEDDLFCQTNLWFCLSVLYQKGIQNAFLVRPDHDEWTGFGQMNIPSLERIYKNRALIKKEELYQFHLLWNAYTTNNEKALISASNNLKGIIPRIDLVVKAHIDRKVDHPQEGLPFSFLKKLKEEDITEFKDVFQTFTKELGIYGYGDLQVRKMWDEID